MNQKKTLPQSRLEGEEARSSQPQRQELVVSTDKKADGPVKKGHSGNYRHGFRCDGRRHRISTAHSGMLTRCYNPRCRKYKRYGARGITVCDRWRLGDGWRTGLGCFAADMGFPPDGCSLDRINNDGNYEPSNCRWATPKEQCNNTRRNVIVEFNGRSQNITQWASELGFTPRVLWNRIFARKWSIEDSLTRPLRKHFSRP